MSPGLNISYIFPWVNLALKPFFAMDDKHRRQTMSMSCTESEIALLGNILSGHALNYQYRIQFANVLVVIHKLLRLGSVHVAVILGLTLLILG